MLNSIVHALAWVGKIWRDEGGVTAIEYALIAAIMAVAVTVVVLAIGEQVHGFYLHLQACMTQPATC